MPLADIMNAVQNWRNQELNRQLLIATMAQDYPTRAGYPYMPTLQHLMGFVPNAGGQAGGPAEPGYPQNVMPGGGGAPLPQGAQMLSPGGTPETAQDMSGMPMPSSVPQRTQGMNQIPIPEVMSPKNLPLYQFAYKMQLMNQLLGGGLGGGGGLGSMGGMPASGIHFDPETMDFKMDFAPGQVKTVPAGTPLPRGTGGGGARGGGAEQPLPSLPGTPPRVVGRATPGAARPGVAGAPAGGASYLQDPATQKAFETLGIAPPPGETPGAPAGAPAAGAPRGPVPESSTVGNITTAQEPEKMTPETRALAALAAEDPTIQAKVNQARTYEGALSQYPELNQQVRDRMTKEEAISGAGKQTFEMQQSSLAEIRKKASALKSYLKDPKFEQMITTYLPEGGPGQLGGFVGMTKAMTNVAGQKLRSYATDTASDIQYLKRAKDYIIGNIQNMNTAEKQGGLRITTPELTMFGDDFDRLASGNMTASYARAFKQRILDRLDSMEADALREYGRYLPGQAGAGAGPPPRIISPTPPGFGAGRQF